MIKKPKWRMPKHLEPYRNQINNTGGNSIEKLMNYSPDMGGGGIDPLGVLSCCVSSQIQLLNSLYNDKKLS